MTTLQVRTDQKQADRGADVLLDWFGPKEVARQASTIAFHPSFFDGLTPSAKALDLFRVAGAVYCTDKVVLRSTTLDAWTRDLHLEVPVTDPPLWRGAKAQLDRTLSFLTGDRWDITFADAEPMMLRKKPPLATDAWHAVSLFSGGLDSLAGVIDRVAAGDKLLLVGHHDSSFTASVQARLEEKLAKSYGQNALQRRHLYLRPATGMSDKRARSLPRGIENTTRSRSFLFIAAGIAVADALGAQTPLYVPENGFIGINVPLTGSRAGALSTRTTHPLYMAGVHALLETLGLQHSVVNPYRLRTKGELLKQSADQDLVLKLARESISCSHPEARRWIGLAPGNCGWCYPCIIRRASLHHVDADTTGEGPGLGQYGFDALTRAELLDSTNGRGRSLRALTLSLRRPERVADVLLNGRIPNGETEAFFGVYARGRQELRAWLRGAGPDLAQLVS